MTRTKGSLPGVLISAASVGAGWQLAVNLLASRPLLADCSPSNCLELDLLYGFPIVAIPAVVAWRLGARLRDRSVWLLATLATGGVLTITLDIVFLVRLGGSLAALLSVVVAHPFFTLAPVPIAAAILGLAGLLARREEPIGGHVPAPPDRPGSPAIANAARGVRHQ